MPSTIPRVSGKSNDASMPKFQYVELMWKIKQIPLTKRYVDGILALSVFHILDRIPHIGNNKQGMDGIEFHEAGMELRDTKVGVLDKAMAILQAFQHGDVALSPMEIARRTKLSLPTVYRLAQAMSEHGLLMKDGQQFRLGLTLLRLGSLVSEGMDVRGVALSHLRWLKDRTGENVELQICHDGVRVTIEYVAGTHNLRPTVAIGTALPLHMGAGGKVLLAWQATEERDALIKMSRERFNDDDQSFDRQAFYAQLDYIRAVGWAASEGERVSDVSGIAAPIFNIAGQVSAAVVLAVPTIRFGTLEKERYVPLVCAAARYASHDLGYSEGA